MAEGSSMKNRFKNEKLEDFLSGTFHQDIESPSVALAEYMEEVDAEWLSSVSYEIECFLESELSDYEKEEFIVKCTEIHYPSIGMKPIEWLKHILDVLKKHIN